MVRAMQKRIRVRVKSTDEMFQIAIRDSADITRLARRFIAYDVLMIHAPRHMDLFFLLFLLFFLQLWRKVRECNSVRHESTDRR